MIGSRVLRRYDRNTLRVTCNWNPQLSMDGERVVRSTGKYSKREAEIVCQHEHFPYNSASSVKPLIGTHSFL
jgi:hypothetical protein